jgi:serine/threonine protein kinase
VLASRYRLDGRIAVGGVGEVWQAEDLVLRRPVALKLLRPEFTGHRETLDRFRSEARHAASLSHPGIAQVYDYNAGSDPYPPFLVMELVDGPSLADVLADGPLEPARVMDIVAQAAMGLDAAHRSGLVHRDIKPANVLLAPGGRVKITDFGIANAAGSAPVTRQGTLIGTPAYLAPERVTGQPATPASDLYSLGILAYECLTGARPFSGSPLETALAHGQQPLPALPASVPPHLADFVTSLAAKDPAERPASAAAAAKRATELRDSIAARQAPAAARLSGPAVPLASPSTMVFQHPDTITDMRPLPVGDPRRPWAQSRRGPRRSWPAYRVGLAIGAATIVAGVAGWMLSGVTSGTSAAANLGNSPGTSVSSSPPAGTVTVRSAALVGQPVRLVYRYLRTLGLRPEVRWVHPGGQSPAPGTVLSVQPSGPVTAGSVVVVTAVRRHGHGHDHGQGQGSNGD